MRDPFLIRDPKPRIRLVFASMLLEIFLVLESATLAWLSRRPGVARGAPTGH